MTAAGNKVKNIFGKALKDNTTKNTMLAVASGLAGHFLPGLSGVFNKVKNKGHDNHGFEDGMRSSGGKNIIATLINPVGKGLAASIF